MAKSVPIPYTTHNMHQQHTQEEVPIVGNSGNNEWEHSPETLHQGAHFKKPTTDVNTVDRGKKIWKDPWNDPK